MLESEAISSQKRAKDFEEDWGAGHLHIRYKDSSPFLGICVSAEYNVCNILRKCKQSHGFGAAHFSGSKVVMVLDSRSIGPQSSTSRMESDVQRLQTR